ncbi:Ca-activated chloride channel family protein [Pseudomonas fluvialis]|uniref:Ca-activated chloride channel family protein n=1 Tax=Pseudomonas fluvialis TaxID=1793966 RepID=A0A7X0BSW8_9PSED|nr:VWA domain-containing protein [Pseudomonas fluvialis]MBB6341873.1 Ca-activated chloride channel family protein [Pseudomonas fluvialis]
MIELWSSELWPHWLRPFWLLALPLLGWLLWQLWHREKRSGRWQLLLPALMQQALLSSGRGQRYRGAWLLLGVAWLLAILVLLGPSWQRVEHSRIKRADPLVVVLDLTPAMLAADLPPSRLEQSRRKLQDLLKAREEAQTALVVYAGSAHTVVPLSDDLMTSRNLLQALQPSIMPESGQRADLGIARAVELLQQAGAASGRILLLTSQLSGEEQDGIATALRGEPVRLDILGVGTVAGAPIALEGGGFLKDASGAIVIPRLQSGSLARLATDQGGRYASLSLDDADLQRLQLLGSPDSLREQGDPAILALWSDQGYWLLIPLLLLAACAGRRGWLFLILLCPLWQPQARALEWADLWQRADQQGAQLLEQGQAGEAAKRFNDQQWQGMAHYAAGDYAAAAERFAQFDTASAHYNRGNALAKSGELAAALDAYDSALEKQPELSAARHNRALVEQLLRQQQQEKQQQQGQQEQASVEQQGDGAQQPPPAASAGSEKQPGERKQPHDSPQRPPSESASSSAEKHREQSQGESTTTRVEPAGKGQAAADQHASATTEPPQQNAAAGSEGLSSEQQQALEQWLRQIPDDPAELLKRKFWIEQQQRQENRP